MGQREGLLLTTTTTNTHRPGTYLSFQSDLALFIPSSKHHRPFHIDDVVHAPTASLDKAASDIARSLSAILLDPITHPPPRDGRTREDSVGTDRRVPVRQPQVSPHSSAISPSPRVSCFTLPRLSLCFSVRFRRVSVLFICQFHFPRPNAERQGQSAWCCDPPSPQGCIPVSTPSTTQSFICSTCLPLFVSPTQSSAG